MKIIISRTDKIGDVILTLPVAGILKNKFPDAYIYFLGSSYTEAVVKKSSYIDEFLNWNDISKSGGLPKADYIIHVFPNKRVAKLAKKQGIPFRIGTSHRLFHLWTCNKLVNFTRKKSELHESQLNTKLLVPIGINESFTVSGLSKYLGWKKSSNHPGEEILTKNINVILHTKSKGSAMEWPLVRFQETIDQLPKDRFHFFISGTAEEGKLIRSELPTIFEPENVTDITGKFSLEDFISFIEQCDGLVACSTGPLHIASAANIQSLGLYPSEKPMHAGRWGPIGDLSSFIEDKSIENDGKLNIQASEVVPVLKKWKKLDTNG
ncbi:MAG: glycosyltransferase family 9 protein [Bacteroidota bacterium]